MAVTNQSSEQNHDNQAFGAMLKKAREKQKLSLDEAAKELFILKRHLQALEEEDFAALPQATFARGFAINYAKYLGLDAAVVAKSFDASYPDSLKVKTVEDIEAPLKPMGTLHRDRRSNIKFNPLLIVAVIGVIILAISLLRMVSNASQPNEDVQSVATDELDGISDYEQAQGAAISGTGSAINNTIDASVQASQPEEQHKPAQTGEPVLDITIHKETNVSVSDASGMPLMVGNQPMGHYQLTGKPPFEVKIANVNDVSMTLNQEVVSLQKYAKNNQASFSLSP